MVRAVIPYTVNDRKLYLDGFLWSRWKRRYGRTALFRELIESESTTGHIPVRHPPTKTQRFGFGELFVGIHYLELGYQVLRHYWCAEADCVSYQQAVEILRPKAAAFICRGYGVTHPPDLFVYDNLGRFLFVEVKLSPDRVSDKQTRFFCEMERFLNGSTSRNKRALCIRDGNWIQIARLKPMIFPK